MKPTIKLPTWLRRPRYSHTDIIEADNRVFLRSELRPYKWIEFEHEHGLGIGILGIWLLMGRDVWGQRDGLTIEYRDRLAHIEIRLPSLTRRMYMSGQFGEVPHWTRPSRETDVYIRFGQNAGEWERVDGHAERKRVWGIDLVKSEHLFDAIKWYIKKRDKMYEGASFRSGTYPLLGKLTYRRKNNDHAPYDEDGLWWDETCLTWIMD